MSPPALVMTGGDHGLHEPAERRDVRKGELTGVRGFGRRLLPRTTNHLLASTVLGRITQQDPVAHRFVEDQHQADTVFFTVERPQLRFHSSMARSTRPAVIIDTGRGPNVGSTRSRRPAL